MTSRDDRMDHLEVPGWSDTAPKGGARRTPPMLAGVVILSLVGVLAHLRGHMELSLLAGVAAVAIAVTAIARPRALQPVEDAMALAGRAVGQILSLVFLGATWVVLVVPVALFNRALGIDLLRVERDRGWASPRPRVRPTRLYTKEPPAGAGRPRRLLRAGIVLGAVAVVGTVVVHHATDVPLPPLTPFGARSTAAPSEGVFRDRWATYSGVDVSRHLFPGEPWARDLLAVQGSTAPCGVPGPDYSVTHLATNGDVETAGLHVTDGLRQTLRVPDPDRTVWMFGGSTTYGIGQRDDHTIASDLVRIARVRGLRLEVVNFGVCNEVNWAETDRFEHLLRTGSAPPDAAIFLDGINDWGNGFVREQFGIVDPAQRYVGYRTQEEQDELIANARAEGYVETHDSNRQVVLVSTQYGDGVRRGRALGAEFGVPVVHYWQPAFFTMPASAPGEATVAYTTHMDEASALTMGGFYREAMQASGVHPVDLTDSLVDAMAPTFFDCCHTNEYGAELEAEAMYPALAAAVR